MSKGKLQFKEYARKKPLSITEGGKLLTLPEVAASATLRLGSLHTLPNNLQIKRHSDSGRDYRPNQGPNAFRPIGGSGRDGILQ